ncbi:MAG: hypothetical protein MMC33_001462 [Icmadophila ericetorum]|nr:hypothetical protein [Icmadophila ericetorum]
MGESRQELLAWMNQLLQLNITKVEQCGTGAALCQIYDSIFQDLPMSRVKFNVNSEYAYIQNFKILQNCFTKHQIERSVPVEALIKCKMQDNLEFLQWTKRFWDQYFPGGEYDALARRKGSGAPPPTGPTPVSSRTSGAGTAARRGGTTPTSAGGPVPRPGGVKAFGAGAGGMGGGGGSTAQALKVAELEQMVADLERERVFYFSKLRDIELLIQQAVDENPEIEKDENGLVKQIHVILYSTEEGFEIPEREDLETF